MINLNQIKELFPKKQSLISHIVLISVCLIGYLYDNLMIFLIFSLWIFNISSLLTLKKSKEYVLTWTHYNIISLINVVISTILFVFMNLVGGTGLEQGIPIFLFLVIFNLLVSAIIAIFLEESSMKEKLKKLLSVLLFAWVLYKLISSYFNSDESSDSTTGFDSNGDGVDDSFDTNGDGKPDLVYLDTDGDGNIDTIAMDTSGDGIIDTVYSDTNGDGRLDSYAKDWDNDGLADSRIIDSDGDGVPDKLI